MVDCRLPRIRRVPVRIERSARPGDERPSAQLSVLTDDRDERLVTRLVDRLVLALIAAATTIGSVVLLGIDSGPTLGAATVDEVLGYFGLDLSASAILAFRVVAGIIRDGETRPPTTGSHRRSRSP